MIEFRVLDARSIVPSCNLLRLGRLFMHQHHIPQWNDSYPSEIDVANDVANQYAVGLFADGNLVGYVALIQGEDPNYDSIDGAWLTESDNYLTLHRLCVDPSYHGNGYARCLFNYAYEVAKRKKASSLRVDTHCANIYMQRAINAFGFVYCGEVTMKSDLTKRNAYELIIDKE